MIEDEIRRNTFWIGEWSFQPIVITADPLTAYAMERQQGTGNAWALSLDDQDVCQLLPLRGDQFEQGVSNEWAKYYCVAVFTRILDPCTSRRPTVVVLSRHPLQSPRATDRPLHFIREICNSTVAGEDL